MSGSSSTIKIFTRTSVVTPICFSVTLFAGENVEWPATGGIRPSRDLRRASPSAVVAQVGAADRPVARRPPTSVTSISGSGRLEGRPQRERRVIVGTCVEN